MAACISAETGTLVFAIINLILVTGWSFLGLISQILWGVGVFYYRSDENITIQLNAIAMTMILLFLPLVTLMFSSFLMNGILKKKPQHIKVYYIFGVLTVVLTLIALIAVFSAGIDIAGFVYAIFFGLYIVYSMILYMIRCTYLQLEINQKQYGHQPLSEKC